MYSSIPIYPQSGTSTDVLDYFNFLLLADPYSSLDFIEVLNRLTFVIFSCCSIGRQYRLDYVVRCQSSDLSIFVRPFVLNEGVEDVVTDGIMARRCSFSTSGMHLNTRGL